MRAAIVYDCLFPATSGGGERVYRRMAEALVDRGAEVDYVTRDLEQTAGEPFTVIPVWRGEIYDSRGNRRTSSAVRFALAAYRHLRSTRREYDIVIASALPVLTLLAARAALRGTRAFLVADWLELWTWSKWRSYSGAVTGSIAFLLQLIGVRAGHLITVNSGFTASRLHRYRRKARPVVLGLIDLVEGAGPDRLSVPPQPVVLFVGRLIPDKRVDALPAAIREVCAVRPDVSAIVVGSGPDGSKLEAAIAAAGVSEVFHLAGRVGDDELAGLFGSAAVLVNPSAREGFGLVVAEAASFGTPSVVVAGDDNAASDLIETGVNGIVVPSTSPADLAAGIIAVLDGGVDLRASTLAWFGRERVERSLDRSVDEILVRYSAARSRD